MARTSKYQKTDTAFARPQSEWRAGLYIRLSREDGDKIESESISSQRAILEGFLRDRPEIIYHDSYIDDGWSGTDFDRPAFQRMLADITSKKINSVIVKDLSRFGRNYVEAGKYLETVFPLFNVRFIAVNDQIDSISNPASANSIIVPFKNIINDEYCRDISMKVRSALDIRRRQGKFIGSFAPYGYQKDERDHNKLVIDREAAQTVREIFEKFLNGYGILSIARLLNEKGVPNPSVYKAEKGLKNFTKGRLWADSTVRRILTNEIYIGNMVQKKKEVVSHKIHVAKAVAPQNRIIAQNTHEPIIAKEDFERVRSLLKRDTRTSPNQSKLSVFAGFLKCADCGRAMTKRTVVQPYKRYDYYCCSTYKKLHSKACTKHAVRAEAIKSAVLNALNEYIRIAVDFDRVTEEVKKSQKGTDALKRLRAELAQAEHEEERANKLLLDLYPDFKEGIISREQYFALKEKYASLAERSKDAAEQIRARIKEREVGGETENEFIATFKKYRGFKELTRDVVCELIENVYIREDGEIELCLKCKNELSYAEQFLREAELNGGRGEVRIADPASLETAKSLVDMQVGRVDRELN